VTPNAAPQATFKDHAFCAHSLSLLQGAPRTRNRKSDHFSKFSGNFEILAGLSGKFWKFEQN
jgi:hypothetical protein